MLMFHHFKTSDHVLFAIKHLTKRRSSVCWSSTHIVHRVECKSVPFGRENFDQRNEIKRGLEFQRIDINREIWWIILFSNNWDSVREMCKNSFCSIFNNFLLDEKQRKTVYTNQLPITSKKWKHISLLKPASH